MPAASRLSLILFGSPRIERRGKPVAVDTRKAVALAAYLAVTGRPVARSELAALFWPEADAPKAGAALRRTLSALNKALDGLGLLIERETVEFDRRAGVRVDLDEFHAALKSRRSHGHAASETCPRCVPLLTDAAGVFRGDFMAGFSLRDCPAFDDWQFFQSEGLRRELAGALEALVRAQAAENQFEAAIPFARRWSALDPLHEPAHRTLMELYARSGQRAAALHQYRECARILDAELGVAPLEETTALYESIRENRSPGEPQAATAMRAPAASPEIGPGLEAQPPLVGRAQELAALRAWYEAIGRDGVFVALHGEAGIGKTRLAEAGLAEWRRAGAVALTARCYEGEMNLVYGPFVEALRAGVRTPGAAERLTPLPAHVLSEAARLLPELRDLRPDLPEPPALDSPGGQTRFFDGVGRVLLAFAGPATPPGVILLDDLHNADDASLELLTYLVRRLPGRPMMLLVTWRDEQLPAGHRLRQLLAEAGRANLAHSMRLGRLDRSAVAELVEASVPEAWQGGSEALIERLYLESEGLPFFLVEYLAALPVAPTEAADWAMPASVRDLLSSRLARVSETGRQLMGAAAVIGRSFDFEILRQASGRSDEETVGGLEALIAQGLVSEAGGEDGGDLRYDFAHEKLRALAYELTSLTRRRLLHQRVAEALAARARGRHPPRPVAGQIAQHYRLAGRETEAAQFFRQAGDHARGLFANAEALAHYRSALALSAGRAEAAALHEAIGDLQTLAGEYVAALRSYETAAASAPETSLPGLEHKLGNVYLRRGDWELAEAHFDAALQAAGGATSADPARIHADWSLAAHRRGQSGQALGLAQESLRLAEAGDDRRALAQAHNVLGILANDAGDPETARLHLEQSLTAAQALGDPVARVAALNNLALVHRNADRLDLALDLTREALALCASLGDRHREAALHNSLADLLHLSGQPEAAMQHLKQAVALFAEVGGDQAASLPEIWKLVEW